MAQMPFAQIPHAQNNVRKSHMSKFRYAYAFMNGAIMRVVYTVFTVFTYEGVYTVYSKTCLHSTPLVHQYFVEFKQVWNV